MKNTKIIILTTTLITLFLFSHLNVLAADSIFDRTSGGLKNATNEIYGDEVGNNVNQGTFSGGLFKIINSLLNFIGVIFFLLLIYAGYLWMTARGNDEQIEKAKKITREVVIGLIIIVLARIITELILTYIGSAIESTNE